MPVVLCKQSSRGTVKLPSGFKPPPGLEPPSGLEMFLDHPPGLELCANLSGTDLFDAGCQVGNCDDDATTMFGCSSAGDSEIEVELCENGSQTISDIEEYTWCRKLEGKWVDRCGVVG